MRIGSCNPCCDITIATYKVKGMRVNSIQGVRPYTFFFGRVVQGYYGYTDCPEAFAQNIWRIYKKRTEVTTSNNGYTKTVVTEYSTIINGSSSPTTTTTYSPDQSTFDIDWGDTSGGGANPTDHSFTAPAVLGDPESQKLWRTGPSYTWSREVTYENLITDDMIWDEMEAAIAAKSWGDIPNLTPLSTGGYTVYPPELGYKLNNNSWVSGGLDYWHNIGSVEGSDTDWFAAHPMKKTIAAGLMSHPPAGYGMRSARRVQENRDFVMLVAYLDPLTCVQISDLDSNGCATSVMLVLRGAGEYEIDAAPVNLADVTAEAPTASGSDWTYPTGSAVTDFVRSAKIPFGGPQYTTAAGCSGGKENRYCKAGAQLNVDTTESTTCKAAVTAASEAVKADAEDVFADDDYFPAP